MPTTIGITFTDDPLLQGRLFSYIDTQLNRMNSANYMQIPINRPHVPVHNNQRDGYQQHNVYKGKVAYYPNKMQDNTPEVVSGDKGGYLEYHETVNGKKQRGKSGKFADHFSQAQLFWNSLTTPEQQQLVDAARFELGKCMDMGVRKRMVDVFNRVDNNLAVRVASAIGVDAPNPVSVNHNQTSVGLSIDNYPLPKNIKAKRVAILTGPGISKSDVNAMYKYLDGEGAYVDLVGLKLGDQEGLFINQTYLTTASVLYDAVYVPDGSEKTFEVLSDPISNFPYEEPAMFVLDAYRHGKPIAANGRAVAFLKMAKIPAKALTEDNEYGVFVTEGSGKSLESDFKKGIMRQRFWTRLPTDVNAKQSPTPIKNQIIDSSSI